MGTSSRGKNQRLHTFLEYVEILPFEYKSELACGTKHFCSNSKDVPKDNPKIGR